MDCQFMFGKRRTLRETRTQFPARSREWLGFVDEVLITPTTECVSNNLSSLRETHEGHRHFWAAFVEGLELVSIVRCVKAATEIDHPYYNGIMHRLNSFDLGGHVSRERSNGGRILDSIRGTVRYLVFSLY